MTTEQFPKEQNTAVVARILEAHKTLVGIAHTLRGMNDFDHAQDMSDAAMFCSAAYNDLRLGENTRTKPLRKRGTT